MKYYNLHQNIRNWKICVKQNKPHSERQVSCILPHMGKLKEKKRKTEGRIIILRLGKVLEVGEN
jgi:hypothetical protein